MLPDDDLAGIHVRCRAMPNAIAMERNAFISSLPRASEMLPASATILLQAWRPDHAP